MVWRTTHYYERRGGHRPCSIWGIARYRHVPTHMFVYGLHVQSAEDNDNSVPSRQRNHDLSQDSQHAAATVWSHQPLKGYLRGVLPAPDCTALVSVQAATEELVLVGLSKPSIRSSDEAHGREARRNEVSEVYIRYHQVPPACPAETDRSTGERPAVLSLLLCTNLCSRSFLVLLLVLSQRSSPVLSFSLFTTGFFCSLGPTSQPAFLGAASALPHSRFAYTTLSLGRAQSHVACIPDPCCIILSFTTTPAQPKSRKRLAFTPFRASAQREARLHHYKYKERNQAPPTDLSAFH